jgi:hypothetical protein
MQINSLMQINIPQLRKYQHLHWLEETFAFNPSQDGRAILIILAAWKLVACRSLQDIIIITYTWLFRCNVSFLAYVRSILYVSLAKMNGSFLQAIPPKEQLTSPLWMDGPFTWKTPRPLPHLPHSGQALPISLTHLPLQFYVPLYYAEGSFGPTWLVQR